MPIISPKDAKGRPIIPSSVCAWNEYGERCRYTGIMSYSTNGSGPWYCREHWCKLNGYPVEGRGNELPQKPLRSIAVEEVRKRMTEGRHPKREN
jgi:hypothetical protein